MPVLKEKIYESDRADRILSKVNLTDGWQLWWHGVEWDVRGIEVSRDDPFGHNPYDGVTLELWQSDLNETVELRVPLHHTLTLVKTEEKFPQLYTGDLLAGPDGTLYMVIMENAENNPKLLRMDRDYNTEPASRLTYASLSWYHDHAMFGPLEPVWASHRQEEVKGLNYFRKGRATGKLR